MKVKYGKESRKDRTYRDREGGITNRELMCGMGVDKRMILQMILIMYTH